MKIFASMLPALLAILLIISLMGEQVSAKRESHVVGVDANGRSCFKTNAHCRSNRGRCCDPKDACTYKPGSRYYCLPK